MRLKKTPATKYSKQLINQTYTHTHEWETVEMHLKLNVDLKILLTEFV